MIYKCRCSVYIEYSSQPSVCITFLAVPRLSVSNWAIYKSGQHEYWKASVRYFHVLRCLVEWSMGWTDVKRLTMTTLLGIISHREPALDTVIYVWRMSYTAYFQTHLSCSGTFVLVVSYRRLVLRRNIGLIHKGTRSKTAEAFCAASWWRQITVMYSLWISHGDEGYIQRGTLLLWPGPL